MKKNKHKIIGEVLEDIISDAVFTYIGFCTALWTFFPFTHFISNMENLSVTDRCVLFVFVYLVSANNRRKGHKK